MEREREKTKIALNFLLLLLQKYLLRWSSPHWGLIKKFTDTPAAFQLKLFSFAIIPEGASV
jgi:hypothetical protein